MKVLSYRDFTLDYQSRERGKWWIVATTPDYDGPESDQIVVTDSESFKADIDEWYDGADQRWIDEIKKR